MTPHIVAAAILAMFGGSSAFAHTPGKDAPTRNVFARLEYRYDAYGKRTSAA